jgi:hypothetical protein
MLLRFRKHPLISTLLLGISLFPAPDTYADASFNSSATIGFNINNITNLNPASPSDISGLAVTATFQQLTDVYDFYALTSGDGSYTANNPNVISQPVTNSFNDVFSVSGNSAIYGSINSLQTGLFSLDFINSGSSSFTIDVTLNYLLNVITHGIYANSSIQLDYWDSANIISDNQDAVGAGPWPDFAAGHASKSDAYDLVFTLLPGAAESLYVQAGISSTLDTTGVAAVPLPTTVWGFLGAVLGLLGLQKRKSGKFFEH